MHTDSSNR